MSNLVKQRFVVEKEQSVRVINSNEKMEQILSQGQNGFTQGIFAPTLEEVEGQESSDDLGEEPLAMEMPEDDQDLAQRQEALLEEAQRQAQEIIESARMEMEQEAQERMEQAYQEGMSRAQAEAEQLNAQLMQEYEEKVQALQQELDQHLDEMEPELVDTFLSLIREILHVELEDYRQIILDLIKQTLYQVENPKEITITVSEENHAYVKEHLEELLEMLGTETKIDVLKGAQLSPQTCKIETEYGIYDCGFDMQLRNLCHRIKVLSRQK